MFEFRNLGAARVVFAGIFGVPVDRSATTASDRLDRVVEQLVGPK